MDTEDPQTVLELLQLTPGWAGESTQAAKLGDDIIHALQLTPGWARESTFANREKRFWSGMLQLTPGWAGESTTWTPRTHRPSWSCFS